MASRVEIFAVTVAAGTPLAAPVLTATAMDSGVVDRVEILVPPGPAGLVGFQITHSGIPVIPREVNRFIIADDEVIKWDLVNFPTGGAWGVRAYNTDVYDHTLYLRYLVTETGALVPPAVPPMDLDQVDQGAPSDEDQPAVAPPVDFADTGDNTGGYAP